MPAGERSQTETPEEDRPPGREVSAVRVTTGSAAGSVSVSPSGPTAFRRSTALTGRERPARLSLLGWRRSSPRLDVARLLAGAVSRLRLLRIVRWRLPRTVRWPLLWPVTRRLRAVGRRLLVGAALVGLAVLLTLGMYAAEGRTEPLRPVSLMGALLLLAGVAHAVASALLLTRGFPGVPVPVGVVFELLFGVVLLRARRA